MTSISQATSGENSNEETMTEYEISRGLRHTGRPKKVNEKWYVINQKWFDRAKKAYIDAVDSGISVSSLSINDVSSDTGAAENNNSDKIVLEPIDNADLFYEPTTYHLPMQGKGSLSIWRGLKPTLVESSDYELLPEKIFKELVRRHGIVDDTHYLERYTVETPTRSLYLGPEIKIDIYPVPCIIYMCNPENGECVNDETVTCIFISANDDLKLVTTKAKAKIDTRNALKVRLWYRQRKSGDSKLIRNDNTSVEDYGKNNKKNAPLPIWKKITETMTLQNICEHVRTGENPFSDYEQTPDSPDDDDRDLLFGSKRSETLPHKIAYELMLECKDKGGRWAREQNESKAIITDLKAWRLSLKVGDRCDAMDSAKTGTKYTPQWFEGIVKDINLEKNELHVHFHAWKPRFDEWIPRDSERLQPRFTKKRDWRSQLKVNERVELNVYNKNKDKDEWIPGLVLKIDRTVEGSEKIFVKELNKSRNAYSYYSSTVSTYGAVTRWVSVWDEKLTEQHTHIKDEKKIEGDVSRYIFLNQYLHIQTCMHAYIQHQYAHTPTHTHTHE